MRYHIDTIPVWDSVKEGKGCPLCRLRLTVEENDVDRFLGGSVMEPDTRIRVNAKGFCPRHQGLLYGRQNRLGHALMMHSHLQETRKQVAALLGAEAGTLKKSGKGSLVRRISSRRDVKEEAAACADKLKALASSCILCDSITENMLRYSYTLLHLYTTDASFRSLFRQNGCVCLPCAADLMKMAAAELSADQLGDLVEDLAAGLAETMDQEDRDLKNFTLQFDWHNAGKTLEGSTGSLERTVNTLRGCCLKEPK